MAWISRIRALLGREKLAREQDEELAFHLSMREQLNVEQGMTQADARRDARRRFGNPSLWRERMSEIDLMILPQTVLLDLRYGARMLSRNPGFTIAAVLALAIGIGANTAAFTAYKAFFKRSLDARVSGQMVNLALMLHSGSGDQAVNPLAFFSIPDYEAYRDHVRSFNGLIAATNPQNLTLTGAGGVASQRSSSTGSLVGRLRLLPNNPINTETASTFLVSENYFSVLGVGALRGRTFAAGESSKLSASPSALISENYWQKRFGGDPAILGKTIRLNGVAVTIVGITPHNFVGTNVEAPDFWLPLDLEPLIHPDDNWLRNRENVCCRILARLAPGVSIDQAQAEMTLLAGRLSTLHDPHSDLGKPAKAVIWPGSPFPYPLKLYGGLGYAILLIMAAVGMVLVIACANVASLQLARAASRQSELGMRLSLGASRMRIIRQLLTESALLGLIAGAVALLFSWAFLQVVVVLIADAFPAEYGTFIFHVTPDLGIFAYVFCVSLLAGILFGLAPALESSGAAISSALKHSSGTGKVHVQPNYFQTLGIPLLFGRGFQTQAGQPATSVILSESAAQLLWPKMNPIGRSLRLAPGGQFAVKGEVALDGPSYEVIGVARDTRGVLLNGSDSEQIYLPMQESRVPEFPILIRALAAPTQIMNAIGPTISSVDPNLVAYSFTLEEMLRQTESFLASSISAAVAWSVGMLGLLLASMGIYGTVSYIVVLRTREVGIRMALGAKKSDVLILMLRESAGPVVAGLIAGMCLAEGASYLLRGVLYGLHTVDGISFAGVSLVFLAIALLASYVPSRKAMRVDPMVALRYD
jgi:ABC-type antimicrobial peptide transport system permease subunit